MLSLYGPLSTEFAIVSSLDFARNEYHVKEISLREVDITKDIIKALWDLFQCDDRVFYQVEMYYCRGQVSEAIHAIITSGKVESLCLFSGTLAPTTSAMIGSSLTVPNNQMKKLRFNGQISHDDWISLFSGINSRDSKLEELTLNGCTFDDESVFALSTGLSLNGTIKVLSLAQCYLEDRNTQQIIQVLETHPSMRDLNLSGNICRRQTFEALARLLASPQTVIRSIDLTWQLDETTDDFFDIRPLALGLRQNATLKRLNLSRNPHISDEGIQEIAAALEEHTSLEQLLLPGCSLSDAALQSLTSCLASNTSLKQLWLQSTQAFTGAGVTQLVRNGLRFNYHLEDILLSSSTLPIPKSEVDDDDDNNNNKDDSTKIPTEVLLEMQHLLDLNRCGRRLLNSPKPVALPLWPMILDRIWGLEMRQGHYSGSTESHACETSSRHHDAIYHFLREKLLVET